jgi:hypothetical protein
MMKKTSGVALAVDDFCALAIVDGNYKVITSRPESCAYKVYWSKGESCHEKIEQASTFKPIEDLFLKNV